MLFEVLMLFSEENKKVWYLQCEHMLHQKLHYEKRQRYIILKYLFFQMNKRCYKEWKRIILVMSKRTECLNKEEQICYEVVQKYEQMKSKFLWKCRLIIFQQKKQQTWSNREDTIKKKSHLIKHTRVEILHRSELITYLLELHEILRQLLPMVVIYLILLHSESYDLEMK